MAAMGRKEKKKQREEAEVDAGAEQGADTASASLEDQLDATRAERDEAMEKYQRALADFRNYQKRSLQCEANARTEGSSDVVRRIVTVLDYFDMALGQDPEKATAAQIIEGVRLIKGEVLRAVADFGVTVVEPDIGSELDPMLHEGVGEHDEAGIEPGCISQVVQPGYRMGERMIRAAKVMVAPGASADNTEDDTPGDEEPNADDSSENV